MQEQLAPRVVALLNDLESYRRMLRLYPPGHPGLVPAETRLRGRIQALAEAPLVRLVLNPDRVFWGEEEVVPPPEAPARKLVHALFQLGLAVMQMTFPEAEEGLVALAQELAKLSETPREEDRQRLLAAGDHLPGVQLFPLDLSGVQVVSEEEVSRRDGTRLVWPQLARLLARDGAFAWPGKLKEGLLDAGSVLDLANQVPDPGALFEYLFKTVAQVVEQTPQAQRPLLLSELRLFLQDLCLLASDEQRRRAVAAFLRQPSLAALLGERDPFAPLEALLDGVELLLLEGEPVPEAVQRLLFRLAAPEAPAELAVPVELVSRARALLARLPLPGQEPEFPPPTPAPPPVRWEQEGWARELSASLAEGEVHAHLIRLLGEMLTLWPGAPAGEAAAARLAELFVDAVALGDLATAQRLAPMVGGSRNVQLQEKALREAVEAVVTALGSSDRAQLSTLTAILSALGERALPSILEALANEESLSVRKRLLEVVLRYGSRAVPYVRLLLEDERWYVVRNAVFILRRLEDRAIVPVLKNLLPKARPQVVEEILKALVAFQDPEWFALLRREVLGEDEDRAAAAISVASRIRHPGVVRLLAERLRQQLGMRLREPITFELIRALGRLRDPAALPILQEILELKQWRYPFSLTSLRQEAAMAIAQLEGSQAQQVAQALASGRDAQLAEAVRRARAVMPSEEEE